MNLKDRIAELPTPLYLLAVGGLGLLGFLLGKTIADLGFYLISYLINHKF